MPNQPAKKDDPLRGKKSGKWTKYGGAIYGLVKEAIQDTWYCQICGDEVPEEIRPFLFEMFPGDFIRICPKCTHTASKEHRTVHVVEIIQTMRVVRS